MDKTGGTACYASQPTEHFQDVVDKAGGSLDSLLISGVPDRHPVTDSTPRDTCIVAARSDESKSSDPTTPLASCKEQKNLFLQHLGPNLNSNRISDDKCFDRARKNIEALSLALANVPSYLSPERNTLHPSLDTMQMSFLEEKGKGEGADRYPGLWTIFGSVLRRLDEDCRQTVPRDDVDASLTLAQLPYTWTELYMSLSVLDKSSPHAPIGILAGLWGVSVHHAESVCRRFMSLGLGAVDSTDSIAASRFRLHNLQIAYCMHRIRRSSSPTTSLPSWHARLLESLVSTARETIAAEAAPGMYPPSASSGLAAQYVEAFCAVRDEEEEFWFEEYWASQLVRHVSCINDGVIVARDVVTDYRWVRKAAERCYPANVVDGIEQLLEANMAEREEVREAGSSWGAARGVSRDISRLNDQEVSELVEIANVFRSEIPPEVATPQPSVRKEATRNKCALHPGERSVGDPGLAHRILGRFGFSRGACDAGEESTAGSPEAGRTGAIAAIAASVRKYARGPWLSPKHSSFVGLDRNGVESVIPRPAAVGCVAYSHKGEDYVALGDWNGNVYLHLLDSGKEVGVLHVDERTQQVCSIAVSSRGPSVRDGVDATWLVVGHVEVVRLWDVERLCCFARLHAHGQVWHLAQIGISRDRGRVVAYDSYHRFLHVWDVTPEGGQSEYESAVATVGSHIASEFAAAAALFGGSRPLELCDIRAVRFSNRRKHQREHWHKILLGPFYDQQTDRSSISPGSTFAVPVWIEKIVTREMQNRLFCARVQGCDSRPLVVAVDEYHGGITVLDGLTGEKRSEFQALRQVDMDDSEQELRWVAASQVDGRTLVATSDSDSIVRVRAADSGEVFGEWRAPNEMYAGFLDGASRRVMGLVENGLIIWSFAGGSSGRKGGTTAEERKNKYSQPAHMMPVECVGLSPDGKTAVSLDGWGREWIVWDAASWNSTRRVNFEWPGNWTSRAVAVSNCVNKVLIVGTKVSKEGMLLIEGTLFDSLAECRSSASFQCDGDGKGEWSAAFAPDGRRCVLTIDDREKGKVEVHQWTISDAGEMAKVEGGRIRTTLPPSGSVDVVRPRNILLDGERSVRLAVRSPVCGEEVCCTCTAIAYFDSPLWCYCSWSNMSLTSGNSEHNSSTVMVGLGDGTVHLMEFHVS